MVEDTETLVRSIRNALLAYKSGFAYHIADPALEALAKLENRIIELEREPEWSIDDDRGVL